MKKQFDKIENINRQLKSIERKKKALLWTENVLSFILISVVAAAVIFSFTFILYGIAHFIVCVDNKWIAVVVNLTFGIILSVYYTVTSRREQLNKKSNEEGKDEEKAD